MDKKIYVEAPKNSYKKIMNNKFIFKNPRQRIVILKILEEIQFVKEQVENICNNNSLKNIQMAQDKLFDALDMFLKNVKHLEPGIKNDILLPRLKQFFRDSIGGHLFKSRYFRRGYTKPKGYPGDYQIIEAMYNNNPISKGVGYLFDKYFLQVDYVRAVRDRKDSMKGFLKRFIYDYPVKEIKILNIACGSCREIRELIVEGSLRRQKISFNLIDQDKGALNFAKKEIAALIYSQRLKFNFFQYNVNKFVMKKILCKKNLDNKTLFIVSALLIIYQTRFWGHWLLLVFIY